MKFLFPPAVFAVLFPLVPLVVRAQQDVPAPNVEALIREIEAMEGKQKEAKLQEKKAVLGAVLAAAASGSAAANFYEKAVEEVQFTGKKDKGALFADWKKTNAEMLRSKELQTALQLHLKYLSMALQRKGMEKPETMIPPVMAYVNEVVASDKLFASVSPGANETKAQKDERTQKEELNKQKKTLLDQPLGQSVFSQWLKLEQWLPDAKEWEPKPGDVAGILEKNVRPILREKKDPQIVQTWDLQLKIEADRLTAGRSDFQNDKFNSVTRPTFLFKRAQDMVLIGQPNRGLVEMVAVLRANPSHPDFPSWLTTVRGLLKPVAPPEQTSPQ
ncbi:MAG: hypothetical protein WCS31_05705 [Verrucomicrobiae bacterium]